MRTSQPLNGNFFGPPILNQFYLVDQAPLPQSDRYVSEDLLAAREEYYSLSSTHRYSPGQHYIIETGSFTILFYCHDGLNLQSQPGIDCNIFFQESPLPSVGGDDGEGGPKGLHFVHPHPHPPPSKGEGIIGETWVVAFLLESEIIKKRYELIRTKH